VNKQTAMSHWQLAEAFLNGVFVSNLLIAHRHLLIAKSGAKGVSK